MTPHPDATGPSDPRGREMGETAKRVRYGPSLAEIAKRRVVRDIAKMRSVTSPPCLNSASYLLPPSDATMLAERLQIAAVKWGGSLTDGAALAVAAGIIAEGWHR